MIHEFLINLNGTIDLMRYLLLAVLLLLSHLSFAQEEIQLKKYSYSEFFEIIENEEGDFFSLKNAVILYDSAKDYHFYDANRDSIHVTKSIQLENVAFDPNYDGRINYYFLTRIVFHESVYLKNVFGVFQHVHFKDDLKVRYDYFVPEFIRLIKQNLGTRNARNFDYAAFNQVIFEINPSISSNSTEELNLDLEISECEFRSNPVEYSNLIYLEYFLRFVFTDNHFTGTDSYGFVLTKISEIDISYNDFGSGLLALDFRGHYNSVSYINNNHNELTFVDLTENTSDFILDWQQFKKGILSSEANLDYIIELANGDFDKMSTYSDDPVYLAKYKDSVRIADQTAYKKEIKLLGTVIALFKRQHDMESANASYIALKDLETQRLRYLYGKNPSFNAFFKWKINQFLKIFSAYGTEPAKAVTYSVYVILAFALVYLFFPNYWDSHGKNRIKNRFLFFHKYLRHNKGIQDVYMEEQQAQLQSAYAFQQVLDDHKSEVPPFFYKAAKPLYRWSVASTTLYANLLSQVDFLKGSWKDTDPKKRKLRTFLTIVVFIFALVYDLFIKILNALMLSINTFTTLGFGEIPIKGLPRYLAIIQGFIGWFMLTIFSVSLISQLLN